MRENLSTHSGDQDRWTFIGYGSLRFLRKTIGKIFYFLIDMQH